MHSRARGTLMYSSQSHIRSTVVSGGFRWFQVVSGGFRWFQVSSLMHTLHTAITHVIIELELRGSHVYNT